MAETQTPSTTDSETDLWRKVSRNLYAAAVARGFIGDLQPNALDNQISAMRKATVYAAFIAN